MPTLMGKIRRRLVMPDYSETTFEKRGFVVRDTHAQARLEHTGAQFLVGFEHAIISGSVAEMEERLETVDRAFRGFAYEGAGMAVAIADAMTPWHRYRVRGLAEGPGEPHIYMIHVGIGWAMARLPKAFWKSIILPDPLLQWLALDGYGFHEAYFTTKTFVEQQVRPKLTPPWPDPSGHAKNVIDQGIGRALWFIRGAHVDHVAETINDFAEDRRGDLWSGVGLAATYAGGTDPDELTRLRELSGEYERHLAQGSAFAAKARLRADLVIPHTPNATRVFCELSVEEAAAVTDEALVDLPPDTTDRPAFEVWRERIREGLLKELP
jgi:enediyne biosynthesis protein E3